MLCRLRGPTRAFSSRETITGCRQRVGRGWRVTSRRPAVCNQRAFSNWGHLTSPSTKHLQAIVPLPPRLLRPCIREFWCVSVCVWACVRGCSIQVPTCVLERSPSLAGTLPSCTRITDARKVFLLGSFHVFRLPLKFARSADFDTKTSYWLRYGWEPQYVRSLYSSLIDFNFVYYLRKALEKNSGNCECGTCKRRSKLHNIQWADEDDDIVACFCASFPVSRITYTVLAGT